jgi:hypothetical protein
MQSPVSVENLTFIENNYAVFVIIVIVTIIMFQYYDFKMYKILFKRKLFFHKAFFHFKEGSVTCM